MLQGHGAEADPAAERHGHALGEKLAVFHQDFNFPTGFMRQIEGVWGTAALE